MPAESKPSMQKCLSPKNHVLSALPPEDFERLQPDLEAAAMPHGKILFRPDQAIDYLYFPDTAMISIVTMTPGGRSVEAGVIGWEGVAGINALMGAASMPNENIVQLSGDGWRIPIAAARREFKRGGALQNLTLRFINMLVIQIGQTSLCNRLHSNEERLARWLLMCRDRSGTDEIRITQQFLGIMLGANRATVTMSAIALQSAGYIEYVRGLITITDRAGLEDFTCVCYSAVKREYDRLRQ